MSLWKNLGAPYRRECIVPMCSNENFGLLYVAIVYFPIQNATIASHVFQVIASDPDNPTKPNGMLTYRIQDDIEDASAFSIGEYFKFLVSITI